MIGRGPALLSIVAVSAAVVGCPATPPSAPSAIMIPVQPPEPPPAKPAPPRPRPEPAEVPRASADCRPGEVIVESGVCAKIEDTTWELTTHMPEGTRVFLVDFEPGGRTRSHDPVDQTTEDDEWEIEGRSFRFWFNARYVVHEATFASAVEMYGTTLNVNSVSWAWSARRVR